MAHNLRHQSDDAILDAYERLFLAVVDRARRDIYGSDERLRFDALNFIWVIAGDKIANELENDAAHRRMSRRAARRRSSQIEGKHANVTIVGCH